METQAFSQDQYFYALPFPQVLSFIIVDSQKSVKEKHVITIVLFMDNPGLDD